MTSPKPIGLLVQEAHEANLALLNAMDEAGLKDIDEALTPRQRYDAAKRSTLTEDEEWHLSLGKCVEDNDECPEQGCPCYEAGAPCKLKGNKRGGQSQECGAHPCVVRIFLWTSQWRSKGTKAYNDRQKKVR